MSGRQEFFHFCQNMETSTTRSNHIIKTSIVAIITNIALATFKALVGVASHSIAIVMDAVNNLSDALSSVITIVGTKLSARPADREHPFGFGRIEYFSAIVIAIIILSAGITSLIESAKKIFEPTEPVYSTTTLVIIVVAIIAKLLLGRYVKKKGEQLNSDALTASGADALFDAIITLATLISAIIMLLFEVSIDGILGSLISIVIIKAGVEMIISPVNDLLGARIPPELIKELKQEVMDFKDVHGVFDIILHNYGPDVLIGSLHINVYDTMNAHQIHGLTRMISEQMYERHGIILTVGVYAIATGDNKRTELQNTVMQTLKKNKDIAQMHGFFYFENENRVSIDVVPTLSVRDERRLHQEVLGQLKEAMPDMDISVVIDHNYSE